VQNDDIQNTKADAGIQAVGVRKSSMPEEKMERPTEIGCEDVDWDYLVHDMAPCDHMVKE
jgi:hypothetical protein